MWLDRFTGSGHLSPQSNSRSISPVPQRPLGSRSPLSSSPRGALASRPSSLSLLSNGSTSSLAGAARRSNGSTLKQMSTAQEGPDPIELLEHLLGREVDGHAQHVSASPGVITEEDLSLAFEFGGLSLSQLAQTGTEDDRRNIHRSQTLEDYERDKAKLEDLHRSIRACDDVLNAVETNLSSFRNDLAAVSADIETLQSRSTALNVRLANRQAVEKGLAPIVDELSISPVVVQRISEGPIDGSWVKTLVEMDKRAAVLRKSGSSTPAKAATDVGPLLDKLILKAVERIRDFIVAQIKALRSPNINAQVIQQQSFVKFKELFAFLHRHHETLADEICLAYMNTMRWYYVNQFARYQKALEKIHLHTIDKNDVLGHDDLSRKATVLSSSKVSGPPHDAYTIGRRVDILKALGQAAISSYVAEEDHATHYLETPFRNFNLALIDNATAEYTFQEAFFAPALSFTAISKSFNYVFEPTFALGQALTRTLVAETYDLLGVLLCIRLNQRLAFELQRRKIPAVEGYINATNMLLWPRLQLIMDQHCESVRAQTSALPNKPSSTAASKQSSAAPHVTAQRFGQLLQGVLMLSIDAGDDEPVVSSMLRLRSEVEAFLTKNSQASFGADARKRERFLYNNYSLILTIISDVPGKLAADQQDHFKGLKRAFQEAA